MELRLILWRHSNIRLASERSVSNLLWADRTYLCGSFGVGRIDDDLDGAPAGSRAGVLPFAKSEGLELRIIEGKITHEVVADHQGTGLREDQVFLRIAGRARGDNDNGEAKF